MRTLIVAALVLASMPSLSAPFPTADQNPLLSGFLLNLSAPARLPTSGQNTFSSTVNWSSTAVIQDADNEHLIVDAESGELRLSFAHSFSDRLTVRAQLPYRASGGGSLDGFVDDWHSIFGLPNGDRPVLPQNAYLIDYKRNGATIAHYAQSSSGIGDISLAGGYQLRATPTSATSLWLNIKAPTGDSAKLTGSGATDVALSLAYEKTLSSRWSAYAQLNFAYLGKGDLLAEQQRDSMWSGTLTFDYHYSPAFALTLQFDGHTAAYADSNLPLLSDAWIMTIGGEYRWRSRWFLQLGVSEDIQVEASPDVNFVLSVGRGWK
jgi:hypothetical protein